MLSESSGSPTSSNLGVIDGLQRAGCENDSIEKPNGSYLLQLRCVVQRWPLETARLHNRARALVNSSQSVGVKATYLPPLKTYSRSAPTFAGSTPSVRGWTLSCFKPIEFNAPDDTILKNRGTAKLGRSFWACLRGISKRLLRNAICSVP